MMMAEMQEPGQNSAAGTIRQAADLGRSALDGLSRPGSDRTGRQFVNICGSRHDSASVDRRSSRARWQHGLRRARRSMVAAAKFCLEFEQHLRWSRGKARATSEKGQRCAAGRGALRVLRMQCDDSSPT